MSGNNGNANNQNSKGINNYVTAARIRAGNPQIMWNDDLFDRHMKARNVAFNTRMKYESEKNAAKKEALLKNVEKANSVLNALANHVNAESNANYRYLEEYEDMVNRGEGEVVPVKSLNHVKQLLNSKKSLSRKRAARSNTVRANVAKRAQLEPIWANSTPNAGGGSSQRKSRKTKKSRKTRKY